MYFFLVVCLCSHSCTSCSLVAVVYILYSAIVQLISFIQVTEVYRIYQSALWVYIIQTIINEYMRRRHAVSKIVIVHPHVQGLDVHKWTCVLQRERQNLMGLLGHRNH